jgi:hypothetical protein
MWPTLDGVPLNGARHAARRGRGAGGATTFKPIQECSILNSALDWHQSPSLALTNPPTSLQTQ